MTRRTPNVRQYMTRLPVEVERSETVAEAARIMQTNDIRHIPVMSGSHLQGVISHRDILEARAQFAEDADQLSLADICQTDVLTVHPLCAVNEVAERMLRRKVGSAIVVDGGFVVGVFTTTDALRVLSDVLGRKSSRAGQRDDKEANALKS